LIRRGELVVARGQRPQRTETRQQAETAQQPSPSELWKCFIAHGMHLILAIGPALAYRYLSIDRAAHRQQVVLCAKSGQAPFVRSTQRAVSAKGVAKRGQDSFVHSTRRAFHANES